jgi:Mg-chelatase subunit ChlI
VAAINPCRCGYLSEPGRACGRAPRCAQDYQSRISGPLLDRIDLRIEVAAVSPADLALPPAAEASAEIARRVAAARARQSRRYAGLPADRRIRTNAEADGALLDEVAMPEAAGRALLHRAAERLRLSARGYHRVLRVARTLADLDGAAPVPGTTSPRRCRTACRSTRRNAPPTAEPRCWWHYVPPLVRRRRSGRLPNQSDFSSNDFLRSCRISAKPRNPGVAGSPGSSIGFAAGLNSAEISASRLSIGCNTVAM